MVLNKQRGNMYGWVTHTINPLGGRCGHNCMYCYGIDMGLSKYEGPARMYPKELSNWGGDKKCIFVCSMTDMFAVNVPSQYIIAILEHCRKYDKNEYLFQTKNPERLMDFLDEYPTKAILGTTLETNEVYRDVSKAPIPYDRYRAMVSLRGIIDDDYSDRFKIMVSIEPVMQFDEDLFEEWLRQIQPDFISIGADSKKHGLMEPSADSLRVLIERVSKFSEVRIKPNLHRIIEKKR